MIKVFCDNCNNEYQTYACWIKRQMKHFCSKKCYSETNSKDMTGEGNYNFRNSLTSRNCKKCNKEFKFFKSEEKFRASTFCSRKCLDGYRRENNLYGFKLDKHWNWQGGLSFEQYPLEFHKKREYIRNKFNRECQLCNAKENKRRLDVHHIDYDKQNANENNLIPLCISCHMKTNFNRDYWKNLFKLRMEKECLH